VTYIGRSGDDLNTEQITIAPGPTTPPDNPDDPGTDPDPDPDPDPDDPGTDPDPDPDKPPYIPVDDPTTPLDESSAEDHILTILIVLGAALVFLLILGGFLI
jgi:hypothetical protein